MPKQRPESNERIMNIEGRLFVFRGDEMAHEIAKGKIFAGARVHESGRWASCLKCNKRIAVGTRCTCGKQPRDHKNQRQPDKIKGT